MRSNSGNSKLFQVIGDRWHFINPRLKRRDLSDNGDTTIKNLKFAEGVRK